VVHELAGAAALAAVLYLGPRRERVDRPHNIPSCFSGPASSGSAGSASTPGAPTAPGAVATAALVNTQLGAATGMLVWMAAEWIRRRKPSGVGIASGAVAGLAAITPASGYVPAWASLVIGAAAGLLCYGAVQLKSHFRYDDALDVVGVTWSAGPSASSSPASSPGWPSMPPAPPAAGRSSASDGARRAALVYPFVMTWIVLWVTDKTVGLRVEAAEAANGLDLAELAEVAYVWPADADGLSKEVATGKTDPSSPVI